MSAEIFKRRFREQSPVVLTNVGSEWPARWRWTRTDLTRRYGHKRVLSHQVHQGTLDNGPWFGNETIESILSSKAGPQVYTFNPTHSMVTAVEGDWAVPGALRMVQRVGPIMSIGKQNSTVRFHQHSENWLAQVFGRKLWIIAPPRVKMSSDILPCAIPHDKFEEHAARREIQHCVVKPQQVLYLPAMWWHATCNLDDYGIGIGYLGGWVSALHQASARGDIASVREALLNSGSEALDDEAEDGDPPLVAAVLRGHTQVLEYLATAAPYPTQEETNEAATRGLLDVAMRGHLAIARALVKMRANLNPPQDIYGRSPLTESAQLGHVSLVKYLLKMKSDPTLAADFGPMPGASLLTKAASRGHRDVVVLLLQRKYGYDVNGNDEQTGKVLHHSLDFPHVAEYIIAHRADPSATDENGLTALHLILNKGTCNANALQLMLHYNAQPCLKDDFGRSPLHIAALRGHASCTELLLKHGACAVSSNPSGTTGMPPHKATLGIAVRNGHWEVVQALVSHGIAVSQSVVQLAKRRGGAAVKWLEHYQRNSQHQKPTNSISPPSTQEKQSTLSSSVPRHGDL
eukprot:gnl/MRDRNA2_/MRDRNA2_68182_c0_seq1.p1 gnl/MRDRNA2_/MRDRNA2_68182_c0~~gnl/MRDRNA2_/MRDRNA2_68182_c0_seq1.p1  ORF type:complete len:637 (-),score=114.37 gnl/MRDRNA2_/MRDRNA2_68182_c0_seq1:52-1773(-)